MASLVNGYVLDRRWTFGARDSVRARVLYVTVQAGGAGLTSLLVLLFARGAGIDRVAAFAAAVVPATLCTFSANRAWTFADRTSERPRRGADERAQRTF